MLAPLPRLLCSVCLFGFTPTYKPMTSQSHHHHHHHHYQLTRDHYNPHSGFDAVSAPQSTAKEPDHPYIYHCPQLSSYGLFWVTICIAPAIHILALLSSDFLPYSTDVWPPLRHLVPLYLTNSWSLRTIRAIILTYMGEEAQERRLATSTCPKATIPYERLLLYMHPPPDMVTDRMNSSHNRLLYDDPLLGSPCRCVA